MSHKGRVLKLKNHYPYKTRAMTAGKTAADAAEKYAMLRAPLVVQFLLAVDELVISVTVVFPAHHDTPLSQTSKRR